MNKIREQFGTLPLTINQGSLSFASAISKRYDDAKWNAAEQGWHYTEGINRAAADYGLAYGVFQSFIERNGQKYVVQQAYENLEGSTDATPTTRTESLDSLKDKIWSAILGMLVYDSSSKWGHATSLTGLSYTDLHDTSEDLGVMVDSLGQTHIIIVPSVYADPNALTGDNAAVENSKYSQLAKEYGCGTGSAD